MAYVDAQLLFFEDTALASSMTSNVLDLGSTGAWLHPLYVDVKLTEVTAASSVTKVTLSSSATAGGSFTEEMSVTPHAVSGVTIPTTVAQFFAPIKTGNRYVRLTITGSGTAKVYASMLQGVAVR